MSPASFYFWGGSLFEPGIRILMPSPYSYLPELAHHQSMSLRWSTLKLSAALPWRKAHLNPPKGEPTFCTTLVGEIAQLNPPTDADFVFSDIRGGHFAPVSWAGFHQRVFLPSTFCHSVGEMAPHYSPKRDNTSF